MSDEITFRRAKHAPGKETGRSVLQEVCAFGDQAHFELWDQSIFPDPDPLSVICDQLGECDEAFVAECGGRIVGASTLAFNGIGRNHVPILRGVYVLDDYRGLGIGFRLTEMAMERFAEMGKVPVHCSIASEEMAGVLERLQRGRPELYAKMRLHSEL